MKTRDTAAGILVLVLALAGGPGPTAPSTAQAAELPKSTQAIMAKTRLPAEVLQGLDDEMKVPQKWIDGARKEKLLRVSGTWDVDQFDNLIKPFIERYPFLKYKYARGTRYDRVIKPLISFKTGRVVYDVISGVAAKFTSFQQANAIVDLRQLPNWDKIPEGMKQKDGGWVGERLRYWCMAYNTKNIKQSDLPKTWDDLLTNKKLRGGRIGMGNRPNLWLLSMWDIMGEDGEKAYARRLFADVKPQLRKEGMNALISLTVAGEFDVSLPSAAYRVSQLVAKGAPIGWHCPEPVPLSISDLVVIKGGHQNAALLFANWFLSREGQVSQFAANNAPPVHKDLRRPEFLAFPKEIMGKKVAFREPEETENDLGKLMKFWDPMWLSGRGLKLQFLTARLDKVTKKGRRIAFKHKGEKLKAKVAGSRTMISINGIDADQNELRAGMTCEIGFPGNNEEATKLDCKSK